MVTTLDHFIGFESGDLASEVIGVTGGAAISQKESRSGLHSVWMHGIAGVQGARFQGQKPNSNGVLGTFSLNSVYHTYWIYVEDYPSALCQMVAIATAGSLSQVAF